MSRSKDLSKVIDNQLCTANNTDIGESYESWILCEQIAGCVSLLIMAAAIVGLTGLLAACQPAPVTAGTTTNLTILHTNDTHVYLDNVPCRATRIDQIRNEVGDDSPVSYTHLTLPTTPYV